MLVPRAQALDSLSMASTGESDLESEEVGFECESREILQPRALEVVVKSTFLDVEELPPLGERWHRLRRSRTQPLAAQVERYEPGKFSTTITEIPEIQVNGVHVEPSCNHCKEEEPARTTVMLRNLPNNYTRAMLLALLERQDLLHRFDFLYLPMDFQRKANLGYAFVNLVDQEAVEDAWRKLDGFKSWGLPSSKVCQVTWSGPHQGCAAHVERYRNSPVMHKSVPDEFRPILFMAGRRQRFPAPTKFIKPPQQARRQEPR